MSFARKHRRKLAKEENRKKAQEVLQRFAEETKRRENLHLKEKVWYEEVKLKDQEQPQKRFVSPKKSTTGKTSESPGNDRVEPGSTKSDKEFSMFLLRHQGYWEPLSRELVRVREHDPNNPEDCENAGFSKHMMDHFGCNWLENGDRYFVNPEWEEVKHLKEKGFEVGMLYDEAGRYGGSGTDWNHPVSRMVSNYNGYVQTNLFGNVGFLLYDSDGEHVLLDFTKPGHRGLFEALREVANKVVPKHVLTEHWEQKTAFEAPVEYLPKHFRKMRTGMGEVSHA